MVEFGTGGEYVPPRPAYLNPVGDVPRRAPRYVTAKRSRAPPVEVLRHRALVRTALSTVGFDSAPIAAAGNAGPRLCWHTTPQSKLRLRLPPEPRRAPRDDD